MTWALRYATHLGYRSPESPLFPASAGSIDPVAQIEFAAGIGFAAAQYAQARSRPEQEVRRVARALERHGLAAGCMLYTTLERLAQPLWGQPGAQARDLILGELRASIDVAKRIGARHLVVNGAADPRIERGAQLATAVTHLRFAADVVERAGLVLCLEPISRRSVPGMLLAHLDDALVLVTAVDRPSVRLVFDTSHVQIMDGDLLTNLSRCWPWVEIVQIADNPGRAEPGTGEINFDSVWRAIARAGYSGLVELEYNWAQPGLDSERRGLDTLRRLDALTG
jgi:hydroxypyruvate isomerase